LVGGTRQPQSTGVPVEGVFVLGMDDSGVDLVHSLLSRLGLRPLGGGQMPEALARFNERLLEAAGGSREHLPEIAPPDVARLLGEFTEEANQLFRDVSDGSGNPLPWVWADPANSFLIPFWVETLRIDAAVVLVHRDPGDVVLSRASRGSSHEEILDQWDRYNRAAMIQSAQWPSMTVSYEEMVAKPAETISALSAFVEVCAQTAATEIETPAELFHGLSSDQGERAGTVTVGAHYQVLARILDQLDGNHFGTSEDGSGDSGALLDATSDFYGEDYYGSSYDKEGVPYRRGEVFWTDFFARVASSIVGTIAPRTVLDMGCASGMLVEALRDRGVDAWGVDISTWAIEQVPTALRPFCKVGSITDEIEGQFDLITCVEMLEHIPPTLAAASVANLCRHADAVLFSSTPDDFDEPTHLNVEPSSYWAQLFFWQGFVRDVDCDVSFLAPHAILFRRGDVDAEALVANYERGLWNIASHLRGSLEVAVAEHDRLAERYNDLAERGSEHKIERLQHALDDLERRRSAEVLAAFDTVRQYELGQRRLAALVSSRDVELDAIRNTKIMRYTSSLRRLYGRIRRSRAPVESPDPPTHPADGSYQLWVEQFDTLDDAARDTIKGRVARLANQPTISVIMPTYNPPPELLRAAIDSVRAQLYPRWELCIADDNSSEPYVSEILAEYEAMDPRIKVIRRDTNGHISAACNSALSLATGDWIACLDHDDTLAEHALALVVTALADHPEAGIVYSDEDKLDDSGVRQSPYFKPEFDPLLLIGENYFNHLSVFRRSLVTDVGGYREGYEGSQDWDLALRVSELLTPDRVVHIPHVLYHWRAHDRSTAFTVSTKPYAVDAGRRAVMEHLERTGRSGRLTGIPKSGHNRVTWDLPPELPLVSIIIPTRDGTLLERCIESVLAFTTYPNFELVVVDNSSRTLPTLGYLRANDDRVRVIRDEQPFNYSAINNAAVAKTSGAIVCL